MAAEHDPRPDPDALLRDVERAERNKKRGFLRVFFGMCPGVGKTYAMLEMAGERLSRGVDVVIGIVETHDRKETEALAAVLPLVPAAAVPYRGTVLRELDLDAVLARRPQLVLVDELAHTNAPGGRHPKRYQDVEELLEAGIDVYTTLNVQHLESQADLVTRITGAPVRETVPDAFLDQAEQIELIDLSPPELLKRLREGKVYLGERAERAAANFFKEEHLTALRKLALRFTAERVDEQLREYLSLSRSSRPWSSRERLLVAVSASPYSARLIRATRRKASALGAPWYALYVDTGVEPPEKDREKARVRLLNNLALAADLGAKMLQTQERNVAAAICRMAEEHNITQIVLGRPDRRFFRDIFSGGTILDQLVRETSEIDIHVVRQERKPTSLGFRPRLPSLGGRPAAYAWSLAALLLTVLGCWAALPWLGYHAVGIILLCAVTVLGTLAGLGPTLAGALLSVLVWNYFFIPPRLDFKVASAQDLAMCLAFFPAACVTGLLARRIKRQDEMLLKRERRASALYDFSRDLAEAKNMEEIAACGYESLGRIFHFDAAILLKIPDDRAPELSGERLADKPLAAPGVTVSPKNAAVAAWCLQNRRRAGMGTDTLSSADCLCLPLSGRDEAMGVLMLFPPSGFRPGPEQEALLDTLVSHLGVAFEREHFALRDREADLLRHSERLHQALLNSVSHELRTPLTGIIGAASVLADPEIAAHPERRALLAQTIEEGAERLNRVVENLLDMSRITGGVLTVKDEVFELGEFVEGVLERGRRLLGEHPVRFEQGDDMLVRGDARLFEHVLLNLFANVAAYAPQGTPLDIRALEDETKVRLEVGDYGPGIPDASLNKIFQSFYRVPGSPAGGTGLGLSIAKTLMEEQRGGIAVRNREEGSGCVFTLELRKAAAPPPEKTVLTPPE